MEALRQESGNRESSESGKAVPGAKRLRYDSEERYAQERAFGYRPHEAAKRAGLNPRNGTSSKYEDKAKVQQRIAYLRRDDLTNEMREAKRQRIEHELELLAFANMDDFVRIGETGLPVLDLSEMNKLSEEGRRELMAAVKTVRYTENGPILELHGKGEALSQLRDMRGFKAPAKSEVAVKHDATDWSNEELVAFLAEAEERLERIEAQG